MLHTVGMQNVFSNLYPLFVGAFVCNITLHFFNTVKVSCKLLGALTRIHVILTCNNCTINNTTTDDSPVFFQNLPAGKYTIDVTPVGIGNFNITKVIIVSDDVNTATTNTPTPKGTVMISNCIISLQAYVVCMYIQLRLCLHA